MIVAFDIETTGLDTANDRIVQIAAIKMDESLVEVDRLVHKVNPGIPISKEAAEVHGITNEDAKNFGSFGDIAEEVFEFFDGCDLAGHNILGFDIPLLQAELARCGHVLNLEGRLFYDTLALFCRFFPRHLVDAVRFYCGRELENAHDALADTLASVDVLKAQISRYEELRSFDSVHKEGWGNRVDMAGKFVWNEDGEAVFDFGQHKGVRLQDRQGYLDWMLKNSFSEDTKDIARRVLRGEEVKKG